MRPRGGIIGNSVTPTQTVASGVWTVREAEAYARSGAWPALAGPPTSVAGTAGNAQVALTWTAPSATGGTSITGYKVEYTPSGGSATVVSTGSTAASYTITSLTNGTAYTFRVAAITGYGTGAYSAASSSVTPAAPSFTATAVLLTSGTSYTVPSGATSMKAWAVGGGGQTTNANSSSGAGGCAYKTWSVSGGASVSYSVGSAADSVSNMSGYSSTVTFAGTTITGYGGPSGFSSGGSFSGGDGGASGGSGEHFGSGDVSGGAVGGNGAKQSCGRKIMTDVSGLLAAVALASGKTSEDCGLSAAFGSGAASGKYRTPKSAGYGGGGGGAWSAYPNNSYPGAGAVVLYFT